MIAWAPTGLNGLWQPSNINRYLLNGAEAELIAQKGGINARFSYTYLDGRQTNLEVVFSDWMTGDQQLEHIERPAAFTPAHTIGFNLNYRGTLLKLNLNAEYQSEIINYYLDYANAPQVSMIEKVLPTRTVINGRVSWPMWKIEPFLEARNLLNTSYCEQFGLELVDGDYPTPGRTFGIGLGMEF
jgi:outer membrane receptor for ferrienterochelin and colicin